MAWIAETLLTAVAKASPRECITEARMAEITGLDARSIENAAMKLRKHGLLAKTDRGCHKLTDAGRAAAAEGARIRSGPRGKWSGKRIVKHTLRELAWRAMRLPPQKFTIPDLIMACARGGERDIESNLHKYIRALERAGYLQRLPVRDQAGVATGSGYMRWWLVRDTGPLPPVWLQGKVAVYDQNTEKTTSIRNVKRAPDTRRCWSAP